MKNLSRKKLIDRGYGKRFGGYHTISERRRIEIGVPDRVKTRIPVQITPDKAIPDESLDMSCIPDTLDERLGKCYELCGRLMIDNQGIGYKLVHATLFPYFGKDIYFHAFLEKDNVVYDAVADRFYEADSYYQVYYIEDRQCYTDEEAMNKMVKTGHFGSWD
jgi:hypothetical protein